MTKLDLVNAVAKQVDGLTKKKLTAVVDTVFADIFKALKKGEKVQLVGFGTFDVQKRAARKGRNPQKPSEVIDIPAKKVPVFRAGKHLKEAVNH